MLALISGCVTPQQKYSPRFIPFMKGNCVDRMVIIRNNLIKQGYDVNLVIGTIIFPNGKKSGHAWIEYKDKEGKWINIYNY